MNSLTEILRSYKECQDKNAFKELDNMIYDYLSQAAIEQKDLLIEACKEVLEPCADRKNTGYQRQEEKMTKEFFCFILSLLMRLEKKTEDTNSLLKEILLGDFNADELYYIWNQFKRLSLKKMVQTDRESYNLLERIYRKSYDIYFEKTKSQLEKIPKEQRDPACIVVLTIQLLGMNHAPTKTLIERVKWLKKLGKKVYIVNTTEQYLAAGEIPIYDPAVGSVEESYRNAHVIRFGEDEFDFLQISEKMTIERKLRTVLRLIRQVKPFYILSMGTGSMTADLCGQAIPTASMALAFSNLPHTMNPMKILGRMIREEEKETFANMDVIESRFTFELKEQTHTFTRKEYRIPEDAFVLVIVGIRLDYELSDDFTKLLITLEKEGFFVVLAGKFETYSDWCQNDPVLEQNTNFIGYCEDMEALMEICDLYVNPIRLGGGFSVIEAFAKGVPGVYTKTGDVFVSGGPDFAVNDLGEMKEQIERYRKDDAFYREMSAKAKDRAKLMTSSESAIRDLNDAIEQRVREKYW